MIGTTSSVAERGPVNNTVRLLDAATLLRSADCMVAQFPQRPLPHCEPFSLE